MLAHREQRPSLLEPSKFTRGRSLALAAVLVAPLLILISLNLFPQFDLHLETHWFHFQVVSFISLVALVLALLITRLTGPVADVRTLFITMALSAISGIFLTHGIATPGVLANVADHSAHAGIVLLARPDLVVAWAAPLSLFAGAILFALASTTWTPRVEKWIHDHRSNLWSIGVLLYVEYLVIVFVSPEPLEVLAQFVPTTRYALTAVPLLLYALSCFRFWKAFEKSGQFFDAALTVAAGLLGVAIVPMTLAPLWNLSWWLYHILMLTAFMLAWGAVVREYERVRHFHLTAYFAATSIIVIALSALVVSEVAAQALDAFLPAAQANTFRFTMGGLYVGMSALLFVCLLLIVRRGDQLLAERTGALGKKQAVLERARLTEALVPIGLAMGASLDLDGVLNVICRESMKLFEVNTTLVWFREGDELVGRAADGAMRADFMGMRQPLFNNSLLGARVVRERRPMLVNHARESDSVSRSIIERFGIQSLMGVPLLSEDQVVGALVLIETCNPERFGELDLEVARIFGQQTAMALTHARLYERIRQQADSLALALEDLRGSYRTTLTTLSAALDARDHETEGHSQRVTAYALTLAEALGIEDEATLESLERGALLHDVGKIGVPDSILHKPAKLTELEWQAMRQHPEVGYTILHDVEFLQPSLTVVLHHHERWDGTGYPLRLSGEAIPLGARIFAVVDTLDAITSIRPYRAARSFATARQEILMQRGRQFDPAIVDAFAEMPESVWRAAAQQVRYEKATAPTVSSFLETLVVQPT